MKWLARDISGSVWNELKVYKKGLKDDKDALKRNGEMVQGDRKAFMCDRL